MKLLVNDTLKDLANEYDWECLRKEVDYTLTAADQSISLNEIYDLTGAYTCYAQSTLTADAGGVIQIRGTRINSDGSYDITADSITLTTVTATGGISFSHIDSIRKASTTGTVTITNSSAATIATLHAADTELNSRDVLRITGVYDTTNDAEIPMMDRNTALKGSPNFTSATSHNSYYDIDANNLKLMNIATATAIKVVYLAVPRTLVLSTDIPEFPRFLWPKIVDACMYGYGLRYEDENDATWGMTNYKLKLQEIVEAWTMGRGQRTSGRPRVLPVRYKRGIN